MKKRSPISVVIPTYNGLKLLQKHLPHVVSILEAGDEIVIADDASTDDTLSWLAQEAKALTVKKIVLTWTQNTKNLRFAATVNAGVAKASHRYIFILNNDVSPLTQNIAELLLSWFQDEAVFAVGCAEVIEETPHAQVFGRGTGDFQRGLCVHWYDPDQNLSNTLWAAGGSLMVDKEKYVTLGGLDTLFYPAYEEDRDLSYNALKHGWSVYFEPRARVLHQHESTNASVFGKKKMQQDSWKNQYLFVWKNITDRDLLFQHFLWLPYHLIISGWRTQGAAFWGFIAALKQLSHALHSRSRMKPLWKKTDREVLEAAKKPRASLHPDTSLSK